MWEAIISSVAGKQSQCVSDFFSLTPHVEFPMQVNIPVQVELLTNLQEQ